MNSPDPWPSWLTPDKRCRINDLSLSFAWMVVSEPSELSPSVWGQWDRGLEQEINIALRELDNSLVAIFPRGEGFWGGRAVPAMLNPETVFVDTFDEVLDVAVQWAKDRTKSPSVQTQQELPR